MYSIPRFNKLKLHQVAMADRHNRRLADTPNSDPDGEFHRLVKSKSDTSLRERLDARLDELGIKSFRKDAVVLEEIVLTASPEFFRPDNPKAAGTYEPDRVRDWYIRTARFLKSKYGDNIIDMVMHLDESTPHIHCMVVPAVAKEKKRRRTKAQIEAGEPAKTYRSWSLCAKELFNREAIIKFHDDYAKAMQPLGLQRGKRKSRATHRPIREYYAMAENVVGKFKDLKNKVSELTRRLAKYEPKPKPGPAPVAAQSLRAAADEPTDAPSSRAGLKPR